MLPAPLRAVRGWRSAPSSAPAITASEGLTLAGNAVAADGAWTPRPSEPVGFADGKCELTVPAASVAVIEFLPEKNQ